MNKGMGSVIGLFAILFIAVGSFIAFLVTQDIDPDRDAGKVTYPVAVQKFGDTIHQCSANEDCVVLSACLEQHACVHHSYASLIRQPLCSIDNTPSCSCISGQCVDMNLPTELPDQHVLDGLFQFDKLTQNPTREEEKLCVDMVFKDLYGQDVLFIDARSNAPVLLPGLSHVIVSITLEPEPFDQTVMMTYTSYLVPSHQACDRDNQIQLVEEDTMVLFPE